MTNDICGAGVGMICGLKTPDNSSARISAFSLSVKASELSARRRGGGESLIRSNDFVLYQRDPFVKERFCRWFLYRLALYVFSRVLSLLEIKLYFVLFSG